MTTTQTLRDQIAASLQHHSARERAVGYALQRMLDAELDSGDGCDRCSHAEVEHYDYSDRCIVDDCDCHRFEIPTQRTVEGWAR